MHLNITNITQIDELCDQLVQTCCLIPDDRELIINLRYIIYGPTLCLVILFGALGNILTFFNFRRRHCSWKGSQQNQRHRVPKMHKYLALLSVWDFMLLISSFFLYNLPYLMYGAVRLHGQYVRVYPYAYAMACASRTGSIWILIASAVDRYFAVCHPFKHHIYSTTSRMNAVLGACCFLSFIYGIPRYYNILLDECWDLVGERTTLVAVDSDLRTNPIYWYAYKIAADFCLVSVGPFFILLYLSLAVCMAVRRSTRIRRDKPNSLFLEITQSGALTNRRVSTNRVSMEDDSHLDVGTSIRRHERSQRRRLYQETQNSLNFMLMAVLAKFLVCHSLPAVLDVCETIMNTTQFQTPEIDDLMHAANALVVLNGSLNVVLYLACSRPFRLGLWRMLFPGLKRERSRSTQSINTIRWIDEK